MTSLITDSKIQGVMMGYLNAKGVSANFVNIQKVAADNSLSFE